MTSTAAPGSKDAGRLGLSQYLGYAGGDVANNLTFATPSSAWSTAWSTPPSGRWRRDLPQLTRSENLTEERFGEVVRQIAFRRAERGRSRDQVPRSDA